MPGVRELELRPHATSDGWRIAWILQEKPDYPPRPGQPSPWRVLAPGSWDLSDEASIHHAVIEDLIEERACGTWIRISVDSVKIDSMEDVSRNLGRDSSGAPRPLLDR